MDEQKKTDNIDLPFITDDNLIGTWNYADFVQFSNLFNPSLLQRPDLLYLTSMEFCENGTVLTKIMNGELAISAFTWTKGHIINSVDQTCSAYEIREIDGVQYLVFEWKSGDYTFRDMDPWFYVMKKA